VTESVSPRVLHVSQPNAGGVAVYVGQAACDQRRRGWDVAVACPAGGDLPERCMAAGVPWLNWDAGRSPGPGVLREALRLRGIVRTFAPDVIHLHSAKAGLAGRLLRRPAGTPTMFQPHGWSWLAATGRQAAASRRWERFAARWSDALVCVGAGELAHGVDAGVQGPYRLVRNGVDLRRFTPADDTARLAARIRLGLPSGAPLAVCVGRVTRQKGQDVLVEAWPAVVERCPAALLAIVGAGGDPARARREAVPGVRFVPAVDDPRDWLAAANVVALPSRWEGLPLIALEALAMGRPVVGSDIPGITEIVRPGLGALVPADDPGALAAQLAVRLQCPELAEREGRAGAEASAGYDVAGTLASLAAVTREVAAGRGRAPEDTPGTAREDVPGDRRAVAGGLGRTGLAGTEVAGFAAPLGPAGPAGGVNGAFDGDGGGAVTPPNSSR
jgi:glycosyltransferase involved in cell wall biosynthesis